MTDPDSKKVLIFKKIEILEFDLLGLPRPDMVILLYVPYQVTLELQRKRGEDLDQNEQDKRHLRRAEQTYLELRALYHFKMIECVSNDKRRSIESINDELLSCFPCFCFCNQYIETPCLKIFLG